ncbi:MAG TPA: SDR family oxidoreductase [Galbitalea sp.]|jgi:3-oxoacyl-[acyl-carrier protein] reductase|nr:SDR family oxidoreductase [Galbitalea sp.]
MTGRVALVTGVGREVGIAAGIVERLAADGWDIAMTYWSPFDRRMPWGERPNSVEAIEAIVRERGARVFSVEADLADPDTPAQLFEVTTAALGPVDALVLAHAEDIESGILDTTVENFDLHFAVNTRASWLLIREFADRLTASTGRIVALTSDHTSFNLPYGASKGALDRVVIAAATELASRGITANVVNPGPIDTGWMSPELVEKLAAQTPAGRLGAPGDTAALVSFLLSEDGGWISGQLLKSDGGLSAAY